jgi:hypothetical protein
MDHDDFTPRDNNPAANKASTSSVEQVTSLFAQTNLHTIPSSRLSEISPEERMEALQALHGASDVIDESPSFVQQKMSDLHQ